MRSVKQVLLLVLIVFLLALILQNQAPLQIRFLWMTGDVSGIVLLLLTAAIGFIAGALVTLWVMRVNRTRKAEQSESVE